MSDTDEDLTQISVRYIPHTNRSHDDRRSHEVKNSDLIREQYNTELEWLKTRPPSDEQLDGKLFMGWYQTEDITSYHLSDTYRYQNKIDMKSIIDDIPRFIVSCRESLQSRGLSGPPSITNAPRQEVHPTDSKDSNSNDSRLLTHSCPDCLTPTSTPQALYVMMDYLVEISVPKHLLRHFATFKNKVQNTSPRSRPQSAHSKSPQRWVFVACHCDVASCYGNLFHTLDNFVPVLAVEHESYETFTSVCEKSYVIVRLPACLNKTTGYTNYWIQQLAKKLSLEQIWIVDDQVKSFYRTVPKQRLPLTKSGSVWHYDIGQITRRLVSYTDVMKHLEEKMSHDEHYNPTNPMSVIGLSNEICALTDPFYYNIPIGAILLNLRNLKDLKFHPELHQIDTQVLACEAVKSGQRVFVCNSFVLLDSYWNVTDR